MANRVNSVDFAVYLRHKAIKRGFEPNVTQIQKWLYACYGIYFAINDKQIFDEEPRAWQYGPVFRNVYKQQKSDGGLPEWVDDSRFSEHDDMLDVVFENLGGWTATKLVNWTHKENGAWEKQWNRKRLEFMNNQEIKADFERMFSGG